MLFERFRNLIGSFFSSFSVSNFRLHTFNAVFVPTFLSIIGVIFYLRLGYIVGAAGVLETILIILLAVSVTFSTALSLSTITTNIKIGDGGAYSIVSKTLGLEVGGSVGIPLYLAQVFSVALYLFGFVEAWHFIFPDHSSTIVLLCSFAFLFFLIALSLRMAIRIQLLVFVLVVLSFLGVWFPFDWIGDMGSISMVAALPDMSFWTLFALFFPAVTGLMAGIGLSGELSNPRRQIPLGVLSATAVTTVLYLVMVFWFGHGVSSQDLVSNSLIMVEKAYFPILVLLGILGATYSSALTTFLAAPRLLAGMANKGILPFSGVLSRKSSSGIPLIATIVTGSVIAFTFLLGGIDAVAPILTMFFLITYSAINVVVFTEQMLGLPSFRPRIHIPKFVPLYGAVSSVFCMFLINGFAAIVALLLLVAVYITLIKRNLVPEEGDIRSGLFMVLAEWAAKRIIRLPESLKHVWKPSILFPTMTSDNLRGHFPLLHGIVSPNGTLTVLGMQHAQGTDVPEDGKLSKAERDREIKEITYLVEKFDEQDIFTSFSEISIKDYTNGICISLEAIEGQVFHPNILFLPFGPNTLHKSNLQSIYEVAQTHQVGVVSFSPGSESWLGSQKDIQVWFPSRILDQDISLERDFDLSLLLAYTLFKNWSAHITLCVASDDKRKAKRCFTNLIREARFPVNTSTLVVDEKDLATGIKSARGCDLRIVSVTMGDIDMMKILDKLDMSIMFVTDAGSEDIYS